MNYIVSLFVSAKCQVPNCYSVNEQEDRNGNSKKIELQVITSKKRKAMIYGINIHNTSTFMDTADREFWRVAKSLV